MSSERESFYAQWPLVSLVIPCSTFRSSQMLSIAQKAGVQNGCGSDSYVILMRCKCDVWSPFPYGPFVALKIPGY